ncbi:MAG: LamG domain-containing protein [Chloroflexota bacterium]
MSLSLPVTASILDNDIAVSSPPTQGQARIIDPVSTVPSTSPLQGFWQFQRNLNDSSGNGNQGTANPPGSELYGEGRFGYALIRFGNEFPITLINNTLTLSTEATLEAWVGSAHYGFGYHHIMDNWNGYGLSVRDGRPTVFFRGPDSWWMPLEVPPLSVNVWHHVAATYDGRQEVLYVDGELAAAREASGPIEAGSGQVALAGRGDGAAFYLFNGVMDNVRVWSRALSEQEVNQHYLAERLGRSKGSFN